MDISTKILSDITVYMKYARYLPDKKRRETWKELVERNKQMHIKKYPELKSQIEKAYKFVLDKKVLHQFLILLNPLAPHISEELNEKLGYRPLSGLKWPTYDEQFLSEDTVTLAIQFNGKTRGTVSVLQDSKEVDVIDMVKKTTFGKKYLKDGKVRKIIFVPGKIMNIIIS